MGKTPEWSEKNHSFNQRFSEFFGNRLAITEKKLPEVASEAGVSLSTLYGYRNGKTPALHESLRLLRATGIETLNLAELLD